MARMGMDVEIVTDFGNRMKNEMAERVRALQNTVVQPGRLLNWEGEDAAIFKDDRLLTLSSQITNLVDQITAYGQVAVDNAQAQADVSARL